MHESSGALGFVGEDFCPQDIGDFCKIAHKSLRGRSLSSNHEEVSISTLFIPVSTLILPDTNDVMPAMAIQFMNINAPYAENKRNAFGGIAIDMEDRRN